MSETIIIGAGPAGLACAAALKMRGHTSLILEKSDSVGTAWRNHYDRLHLHTHRMHSGLPGYPMPKTYAKYPSRAQVVAYLEEYADHFDLAPKFNTTASKVAKGDTGWQVETDQGTFEAQNVIFAMGMANDPKMPNWPGLETFPGPVVHSSTYKNPDAYKGKKCLVVGFGNSGCEIALDLAERGLETSLAVRSPVNAVPKEVLGIPVLSLGLLQKVLPYKVVDALNKPVLALLIGDLSKLGLPQSPKGPLAQIIEDKRIPLLDIGTLGAIKEGKITPRAGLERIEGSKITFADGTEENYDAIILATGFVTDLRDMLPGCQDVLTETGHPLVSGQKTAHPGLYFCSYFVSPNGQIRSAGEDAQNIAGFIDAG